jgi:hypothetical protein
MVELRHSIISVCSVAVNSVLITLFNGRVVPRHIEWSKQQHHSVKSKKNIMRRVETIIKNIEIILVDSLRGYYCEPL